MPTRLSSVMNKLEWAINDIVENGNNEHAGQYVPVLRMAIDMLKEQETEKKCCHDCEYYGSCHDN